ncbi:MAG: hypothetical protein H6R05_18 [Burkholderiaceae bacterium]|nr:hypothetical protein [Burkholderiaceae bacterium]
MRLTRIYQFAAQLATLAKSRNHRLWRVVLISALIQLSLVLIAWHSWRAHHLSSSTNVTLQSTSTAMLDTASPRSPQTQIPRVSANTAQDTARKGAQPLTAPTPIPPPKSTLLKTENDSTATSTQPLKSTAHSPTSSDSNLWSLSIPLQNLFYNAQMSNGELHQDLQTAQLSVNPLGEQRYEVILSNKQVDTRNGNIGFHSVFVANEHGPQPTHIFGGAYLKTPDHPKGFALGALKFNPPIHHSAQFSAYTHFLDRASLIIYLQGALMDKRIQPQQQLQLPIYGVGGVQMQTVRITTDNPSASPCQRCVRAFASGDFGEVKQWSVWYDGARNWQPVFMQMRLGKSAEWVLTLSLRS